MIIFGLEDWLNNYNKEMEEQSYILKNCGEPL